MSDRTAIEQFKQAQGRVSEASYQQNRSYAYAAGYFQSMAEQLFARMPAKAKAEFLRQIEQDAVRLESLLTV